MQAVILAAGFGRRMRPLTDTTHKALIAVGGTTILERMVEALLAIDVRDIVVVTGYRSDDVRAFLAARYPGLEIRFVHNARYAETNNIVSLSLAFDTLALDQDILLLECDILFDPSVLKRLRWPRGPNVALVDRYRPGMDGTVVAVEDGVVTQVFPPHLQGEGFAYHDKFKTLNIYRFDRAFCRSTFRPLLHCYANLIDANCYYELVLGMLINMQREQIHAEEVDGASWVEVDDPNDLQVARFAFDPPARRAILDQAFGGFWNFDALDFVFLRNMYFPADAMVAAMRQALPALIRNYGSAQAILDAKLALHLLCRPERVVTLHGASQAFPLLADTFRDAGVLRPEPTFGEYARLFPQARAYRDQVGVDLATVEAQAAPGDLVVFVNPNSPTGTTIGTAALHAFAARHPACTVLVDESFVDFSGEASMVSRLESDPLGNVIVLKSLSKTLGAPGLRLGYLYACDRRVIDRVRASLPVWNLGAPAEHLLELALKFRPELQASFERTAADREAFAEHLETIPGVARVHRGGGNFLLTELESGDPGLGSRLVDTLLATYRIYAKDVSGRFDPPAPMLRVAVRKPEENAAFVAALRACLERPGSGGSPS